MSIFGVNSPFKAHLKRDWFHGYFNITPSLENIFTKPERVVLKLKTIYLKDHSEKFIMIFGSVHYSFL